MIAVLVTALFALLSDVQGTRIPISKRSPNAARGTSASGGNYNTVPVSNFGNAIYATNVTIGGRTFEVQIDTGSPDLLIIGDVPSANVTSLNDTLSFGVGTVLGNVSFADLDFDGFHVPNQAFVLATNVSSDFSEQNGIIGLGPSSLSGTRALLNSSSGDPPLDRIFRQNTSTPNTLSVLRSPQTGLLSIGEILQGYESITYSPKLHAAVDPEGRLHWQTTLDSNGIIGPDGQRIPTQTSVETVKIGDTSISTVGGKDQFRVVFDTGFTIPQLPPSVIDAIYGRIPGVSNFTQGTQFFYNFSCEYELNITFMFGGVEFPIHPLDLSAIGDEDDDGTPLWCFSSFGPILGNIAGNSGFGAFDAILGDGFLRNAYLLINFGDFVDGSSSSVMDPYIQLLPTTDKTTAHQDFVAARLNGIDTTGSQPALLPVSQESHADDPDFAQSAASKDAQTLDSTSADNQSDSVTDKTWFIVMVSVIGGIVLASLVGFLVLHFRKRKSSVRSEAPFMPPMMGQAAYNPLMAVNTNDSSEHDGAGYAKYKDPF